MEVDENTAEQVEDVNLPMFAYAHSLLMMSFEPPPVIRNFLIYPFPQLSQVAIMRT